MRSKSFGLVVVGLALIAALDLSAAVVARAGLTPEQQCQKGRYDAASKYAQCEYKALAQLFAKNDLTKLQPVLSKCRVKYTETYVKLQKKAVGTGSTCEAARFVDNGNATVTDNLTGLQWEKKDDGGGLLHDKDNAFTWLGAIYGFLSGNISDGLNHDSATCFANLCDWRFPTVLELQTILSEPFPCSTSPCIGGIFGPTAATDYWSSTTLADNTGYAWGVLFGTGEVSYGVKTLPNSVRGVRGGL